MNTVTLKNDVTSVTIENGNAELLGAIYKQLALHSPVTVIAGKTVAYSAAGLIIEANKNDVDLCLTLIGMWLFAGQIKRAASSFQVLAESFGGRTGKNYVARKLHLMNAPIETILVDKYL